MAFSRPASRGFLSILFVLLTLTAGTARAQTTTPTTSTVTFAVSYETSLPRVDPSGNQLQKRNLTLTPEAVSNQDCVDDQRIRFTLLFSGYVANATLLAYAAINGQDCSDPTQRAGATSQCWPLIRGAGAANLTNTGPSNISLQPQQSVDVPVRALMAGALTPQTPDYSAAICGKVDLTNISVQFLYFDPGNVSAPSATHTTPIVVDTIGPAAPTGLSHLPGNTRIQVNWANISGGNPDAGVTGGLTELTGVAIYCTPSTGTSGVSTTTDTDAGCTTVDAGVDETGDAAVTTQCDDAGISTTTDNSDAASSVCTADVFTSGMTTDDAGTTTDDSGTTTAHDSGILTTTSTTSRIIPNAAFNKKYQCGSYTGNSGTTVVAEGLTNGRNYAVAVAATDKYGNVGPLSPVQCEIPEETTDFWEEYKAAGGLAGGCATVEEPFPLGTMTAGAALFLFGASIIRRRKNRR